MFIRLKKAQAQLKALEQLMKEQNVQLSKAPLEEPKAQLKTFVKKHWEAQLNAWTEKLENEICLNGESERGLQLVSDEVCHAVTKSSSSEMLL